MVNNWQLQQDGRNADFLCADYDDYGYGEAHRVSIGDEIESDLNDYAQYGVVVGIIRDYTGTPVCYKVWRTSEAEHGFFDYIQAAKVTMCEPCGSSEWSLGRIGYQLMESEDGSGYFYNPETEDVIQW